MYDGYIWKERFTKDFNKWFYTKWEHNVINGFYFSTIYLTYGIYDNEDLLWHKNNVELRVTAYRPERNLKFKIKITAAITGVFVVGYGTGWYIQYRKNRR